MEENLVNAEDVEKEVSAEELSESTGVKEYIKNNPELAKAYNDSGATDEDINKIIESNPELKDALNYLNNNNVKLTDDMMDPEPEIDEEAMVNLFFGVRDAAYTIIEKKGATFYGIAVALARITRAILDDENAVLPLSVFMNGEYGLNDIYIGAPAVINRQGIQKVIEIPLSDSEQDRMAASAKQLKEILDEAFAKLDAE